MIENMLKIGVGSSDPRYLDELIQQARQGQDAACSALRSELDTNSKLWKATEELAAHSEQAIIDRLADTNPGLRNALTRHIKVLKAKLAGPEGSHEERLLVNWVVQSLLLAWEGDTIYPESATYTRRHAVQGLNSMIAANHRLLEAIVELARARKLVPAGAGSTRVQEPRLTSRQQAGAADRPAHPCVTPASGPPPARKTAHRVSEGTQPGDRRCKSLKSGCAEVKLDLVAQSERAWIGLIADYNHPLAEALARQVRMLKRDLRGPSPPVLERLLVDRIALHWLQTVYADVSLAEMGELRSAAESPRLAPDGRGQPLARRSHPGIREGPSDG